MRSSIFTNMVIALLLLLTPIIMLYAYSNRTSSRVLTEEIVKAKRTQVETFVGQLGQMFAQFDSYQKMLYESTEVRNLAYPDLLGDDLLHYRTLKTVSEEINRLAGSGRWKGIIAVVYPKTGMIIKSNSSLNAMPPALPDKDAFWSYQKRVNGEPYFIETISSPAKTAKAEESDLTVIAKVDEGEIKSDLSDMKNKGLEDPFLYKPGFTPIYNYTANKALIEQMLPDLLPSEHSDESSYKPLLMQTENGAYQVHMEVVQPLGWYLVDYVPIDKIMAPIKRNQTTFYIISGMMLFMACILGFILYRSIRIPFRKLMQGMNFIEKGIYTSRMKDPPRGEFRYLYQRFNSMATRIEELIEDVLKEQIRTKEANVKQLQSQINPHFLYNTLAYIKSMVELGEREAAVSMTMNLSKYYRYTTKTSRSLATLGEELELVVNYLDIHRMLTDDFEYEIDIEPAVLEMEIPRLTLQPLVENVILHAFRKPVQYGIVRIRGSVEAGIARIVVEDNGPGIPPVQLEQMMSRIRNAASGEIDSGLQNVHQRLVLLYGGGSGLMLRMSEWGGLSAEMSWFVQDE
ncbi:sensor histidine kinase [Paenibacillus albus]|uniref:sensor histidine kinase n=1 Tax=Paenibacillus albus TaxID=2495582 RepID=UPI0013E0D42E|nr:sensor histidine kinase [Paenibacillus albus]